LDWAISSQNLSIKRSYKMNDFNKKPKENYGFIYKYTSPYGKSYIGQTTRSLKERAKTANGIGYSCCTYFFNAIQKYGF
jgi:hypothetical protein